MHDVLVLSLSIFFIKSQGVYDAKSLNGVYFFTAAVLFMILAYAWLRTDVTDAAAPGSTPWSYTVNDANLDFLKAGETITLTYTLTATDSASATATDTVTIAITGTNDAPTISDVANIGFTEALGASAQDLSASGTVSFDDIDTNDVVDISTTLTTGAVWSGGAIDLALKALLG